MPGQSSQQLIQMEQEKKELPEWVLLKLGGSVITDKSGDCAIDRQRLRQIAGDIAGRTGGGMVIVHGAGSCGHPQARRHHLDRGLDEGNVAGIYPTHTAVARLNTAVVDALRMQDVEAAGLHPLALCVAENGRIASCETENLRLMLEWGMVPVLHGDVVMDRVRGACIVSGDQVVSYLATHLGIRRVGLATDVAGVLSEGSVVPRINRAAAESLEIGGSGNADVTGGMRGKLAELLDLADMGIESHIFHVARTSAFLDEKDHGGTVVIRR